MNNYWLEHHMNQIGDPKFVEGIKAGIHLYAWMKDGVLYVGTTGRTCQEAIAEVEAAFEFVNK